MGGGKERKMNSRLATVNEVRDRGKGPKRKLLKTESAIKIFIYKTSPTYVPNTDVFWESCKHSSHLLTAF
jgi:hypothetical protein